VQKFLEIDVGPCPILPKPSIACEKTLLKHFNSKNMTAEFGSMFLFVVHIFAVVY